jgi:Fe-S cluster assembly iron-binding protein IscA
LPSGAVDVWIEVKGSSQTNPADPQEATNKMLRITPQALIVVESVTTHPTFDPASGLRIAQQADPAAPLAVDVVSRPQPDDHVVEAAKGRLYLDPEAVRRIGKGTLDAVTTQHGRVQFMVKAA